MIKLYDKVFYKKTKKEAHVVEIDDANGTKPPMYLIEIDDKPDDTDTEEVVFWCDYDEIAPTKR